MGKLWKAVACLIVCAGALAQDSGRSTAKVPTAFDSIVALDRALRKTTDEIGRTTELYEDHSTWENAWLVDSEHFTVRTVDSWFLASDVAAGLEVMLSHFCSTLGLEAPPNGRSKIFIVPNITVYNQLGASYDEHSSFYASFYADKDPDRPVIAVFDQPNPTLLRMQITHGALHQFLAQTFPGRIPPTWIREGLAAYFSIYWDYDWGLTQFEQIKAAGNLIPLSRLFREELRDYVARPHAHMMELGMLFYYLLRFREDTRTTQPDEDEQRGPFREYLIALLRGAEASRLPAYRILNDVATLETDFFAYEFPR